MDWGKLGTKIAAAGFPVVGGALGGPAGAAVGARLAGALGVEAEPDAIARAYVNDPDTMIALRRLEAEAAEMDRAYTERLIDRDVVDRAAAREAAKDNPWMPAIIAGAVMAYFGMALFLPFFVDKQVDVRQFATLENVLLLIVGFYFGSNYGSRRKTELLAEKK